MRTVTTILAGIAVSGILGWLLWTRGPTAEEAETEPDTEVAVRVAQITRTTLRGYVTAYGLVEPAPPGETPAASARIAPAVAGVVAEVKCAEGQQVHRGAVLFQLDSRVADVAAAKARRAAEFAEATAERETKLIKIDGTSQKALQEAERALAAARNDVAAAEAQQELLRARAPIAGTVTRVNVKPGEAADLTTTLAEVVDLDRLVVGASVPSDELARLRLGQAAEVRTATSTVSAAGSLTYLGSQIDPRTGTASLRVSLPPRSGLHPGQFVTLRITSDEHADRLAVPVESVSSDEDGVSVIALVRGDRAVRQSVETGLRDRGLIEVEGNGLQPGMRVVTQGAYALPKDTKIRVLGE